MEGAAAAPAADEQWAVMAHLPADIAAHLVAALHSLPRHQALVTLSALRLTSRHWRDAVDDALPAWDVPAALLSGSGGDGQAGLALLLRRFRNLSSLAIQFATLTDWEEGSAQRPPRLSSPVLHALGTLGRLQHLSLAGCWPAHQLFLAVAALPSLHSFEFQPGDGAEGASGGGSSGRLEGDRGASPAPLAACTALESLELRSLNTAGVEADLVAALRGATALRRLSLYRTVRATAAHAQHSFDIGFATQLTALDLRCTHTTDDAFAALFGRLTNLRRLDISGSRNLGDAGFQALTQLAGSLTALALQGGHRVSEDGATALAQLPCLRSLDLGFSNGMTGSWLVPLLARSLTQLTQLDLSGCPRACFPPTALDDLPHLQQLRHLCLQGCRLPPGAAHTLARVARLCQLDLADNPQLASLAPLTALRELEFLDVSECALEDAHVATLLATLPQIRTVVLNANNLTAAAVLEALATGPACATLRVMSLTDAELDGQSLCSLLPKLRALEELDISGGVSVSGGTEFGEALLAAAEAAPALHTLTARGLRMAPADAWLALVHASMVRRRLLRVVV